MAIDSAALLERAVAAREVGLEGEQRREIRAAGFFFAFDEEPNADRQLAVDRAMRLDRLDAKQEMSLVVIDASRVHRAVAYRGVVRRRLPELERDRRLHVVVLDADERALTGAGLTDDERRRAIGTQLARVGEPRRPQPFVTPAGRRVERPLI